MKSAMQIFLLSMLTVGFTVFVTVTSPSAGNDSHEGFTEQQKLISCEDCHQQETPELYEEWFNSTHGLGGVKCYQCHNTFEELVVSPDIGQSCNSCHSDMVNDQEHTQGKSSCWECHQVHSFAAEDKN